MVSTEIEDSTAVITAIQHFCLHDGPGTRSTVFFKGCPLCCAWCHNPETWSRVAQHYFKSHLCIACRKCIETCPSGALSSPGNRSEACIDCFACTEACPSGALTMIGTSRTFDEVLALLRPEIPFFKGSGGGVTLSGGEPTFASPSFALKLVEKLHHEGLHVTLETSGQIPLGSESRRSVAAKKLVDSVDLLLYDLKISDEKAMKKWCGGKSSLIEQNLRSRVACYRREESPPIWPRIPLVPGVTDTGQNLTQWANLLTELGLGFVTLVPYHGMGNSKRSWLDMSPGPSFAEMTEESFESARSLLETRGIHCFDPGEEDWELLG